MNINELNSFNLADAVKFHRRLNPALWGADEHLLPEVREKLLAVADDFREFLGVDDLKLVDITLSGSNAAYSYTAKSDIDLHLVVEMPTDPVYRELFDAKKYQYNDTHNIRIGGADVELYVQPADQAHHSQGIYSVKNSDWLQVPQRRRAKIDDNCVQSKTADLDARIHAAIKTKNLEVIDSLWNKIKTMRQTGLEKNGEFGCENIAFKLLRNQGCIAELVAAKTAARDRELSLKTKPRERKTVNYGMRDYWYPGTAYAGQDHPAGTESEQVDESRDINRKLSWSDLDPGLSIEDKIEIFETYIIKGNLFETNDLNAKEYFLSLADMCDHLILDQKYIVVPLILINNRLMMLDQPGVMKFLGTHQHALKFESSAGEKTFPSQLMRDMSVTNTFTFSDPQTYDKFRNIMHLKYHFDLPLVVLDNRQDIKENINTDQLKKILHRFYSSCVSKLQLENPPQLRLETTPEWSQENGSFGQYDPDSNTLILATSGRHVLDILRTMAHEMTHRQQDEREPLPADAGATGSPWEDQANAMAGRIMRDWADEQPEMFDGVTLEEASGYIPTKKQARDPRFSMALTQDVRPGAVGKEANKLGLKTDAQGHPALLMKTTNTLAESLARELALFEEQDLFEINMGSKNLRKEAAKTGALAGMEFEMIVPGTGDSDDMEPDMDLDESANDIDDIIRFFDDGDYNSRSDIRRLSEKLNEDFRDWQYERIGEGWYEEGRDFLRDYVVNNNEFDGGEAEATAREELEQDLFYRELPEAEREQMVEKRTGEMLEEFVEELWLSQESRIYEAAREEYDSDMEGDFDERTWLRDIGIDQMGDVTRDYNIAWPYYTSPESTVSINEIGDEFSDAIGRPVNASDRYHGGRREAGHYVVEPDGSLDPDSDDDQGLEFVSPPLPIDDMLSDLNKVVAWAKQKGCYTNDSTGLHINISVPGFSQEKLDFVKLAVLLGDERVLDSFGRAGNTYAKSALKIVKDNIRSNPGPAAALLTKMKTNMDSLATKAIHSGTTAKYTSINTKDGYVEFRSPGGDWLDANFSLIEPTLLRFVVALDAAIDPEKYRQEYQKKLYKLLTADNKDDSTIRYFVDYVAGKIPKAALRSFVKQAQLERGLKKNPVQEPAPSLARNPSIGPRQRYVVKNAAGTPVTTVAASDADSARILANRWLRQQNPGINTNEFSVEPETAENQIQNYHISDTQGGVVRMAFRAGSDEEALDRLGIYNYSHPSEGGYRLSREDGTSVTEPGAPAVGSTTDLQQQRQAAAAAPRPIPGVQDIDIDIPVAPPRGNWDGQWKVVDSNTGEELYRFGGIGNSQADANRIAGQWVRTNSISVPIEVYPVLSEGRRQRRTQEDYDPSNPPGPESPPKMPAGTIKVDVSDMYDWYKLGQHISNLKGIDKSTLGKGPPSTVMAFGSEDLENMYSHALTRLGLKTHDLDEPGEEDLDEQIVNELKINNASGIGAVPNNQQIGYQGLQVVMRPSMFLELAAPLDAKSADERETIEYIKQNLNEKGIGAPWLTVVVPEAWESGDFSQMAHVRAHDGRHRMHGILEQEGNDPVEVHIIVPHMRRRHITDAIVDHLRSGMLNQKGQYVSGPIFGVAK